MFDAKEIKLIRTYLETKGNGKDDPIRRIIQYWTHGGDLVLKFDPHTNEIQKGNSDI